MRVRNIHIGNVVVSLHARNRWTERGVEHESLESVLQRAMPFGGQSGADILLADGDVVFATTKSKDGCRIAMTVLTMAQAVVNMEMKRGHKPHSALPVPVATPSRNDVSLFGKIFDMHKASDDELRQMESAVDGNWLKLVQRELGRRKRLAKQIAHSETQDRERMRLHRAIRLMFTEEQVQALWDKCAELRQAEAASLSPIPLQ